MTNLWKSSLRSITRKSITSRSLLMRKCLLMTSSKLWSTSEPRRNCPQECNHWLAKLSIQETVTGPSESTETKVPNPSKKSIKNTKEKEKKVIEELMDTIKTTAIATGVNSQFSTTKRKKLPSMCQMTTPPQGQKIPLRWKTSTYQATSLQVWYISFRKWFFLNYLKPLPTSYYTRLWCIISA